MSKPRKDWLGRNCVECLAQPGEKPAKLARMQCRAWIGGDKGHECGRCVCNQHGHKVGKLTVCNRCQPVSAEHKIEAPPVTQTAFSF